MITPEMRQWLTDNRETYEFYMLHMALHDPLWRLKMIGTPVLPADFRREEYCLVMGGIIGATKLLGLLDHEMPVPPSSEFLSTYIEVVARELGSDTEEIRGALALVDEMQDPSYKEMYYCVPVYYETWYGAGRSKRVARKFMEVDMPDVHEQIGVLQKALAAAQSASASVETDQMDEFMTGTSMDRVPRRPSGIAGLDLCLNGGWGDGECYLLFAGTKGGKSIMAGQCAWNEASANHGYPMIVSTELLPREYAVRIVSAAAGIPIDKIQDCENMAQVLSAVGSDPVMMNRLPVVEGVLAKIGERIRVHKVSPDEGMDARMLLEREVLRYEEKVGRKPTWVCLDWLGSVADQGGGGSSSSERAQLWESSANGCVKFAETSRIPTLVLAQAVNNSQLLPVLSINDIGISKGIGKNMVLVAGITNTLDKKGIGLAVRGEADMPRAMILQDQFLCVCAARKGEGSNIPIRRDFRYQRFVTKPRDH